MAQNTDDFEAVRVICTALEPFDDKARLRIIRWASEKLEIKNVAVPSNPLTQTETFEAITPTQTITAGVKDIKTFISEKSPASENHVMATIAYYYKFEAPDSERKKTITKGDIIDACRKARINIPNYVPQVLRNACNYGLIDKVSPGVYEINSVGENLVGVALPDGNVPARKPKKAVAKKVKVAIKKKRGT